MIINESMIIQGDCLEKLKELPAECVDCCVTSPPYYGLRDYGMSEQIGLEETPEEYISKLVKVFGEVKRVLKSDGTLWVNIGDTYKNKDLLGIPWSLAFALRNDGWFLRQDIIWHKPNPMPESVTDRCTKSHEYIFLLSKKPHYYFDNVAIQEDCINPIAQDSKTYGYESSKFSDEKQESSVRQGMNRNRGSRIIEVRRNLPSQSKFVAFLRERTDADTLCENTDLKRTKIEHWFRKDESGFSYPSVDDWLKVRELIDDWSEEFKQIDEALTDVSYESDEICKNNNGKRNKRDVWSVVAKSVSESHFATFPEELIKPCILAGSQVGGVVLDPFFGSGTTGRVAMELNRKYIGIELNPEYIEIAGRRTNNIQMSFIGMI